MATYLIHLNPASGYAGCFRVEYDSLGLMLSIENMTNITSESELHKRIVRIPLREEHIEHIKAQKIKVTLVPADLTFDAFWNRYRYKTGNKKRSEALWTSLNAKDKTAALQAISDYDKWLERAKIAKVYPETYLSQRRWESDFRGTMNLFS